MKYILIILMAGIISACSPSANEKHFPVLPKELQDCKIFRIQDDKGMVLYITRCGYEVTTQFPSGKHTISSAVIEGK